ncbi:MAG: Biopolymer transport protein ExbD/TolR [Lacunisphaera sp.]|jgi:biopolymer transport protein ExbD|nr:Biopolymer transport protein ExbD/TolR [Lacunisphaera sp.]MDB6166885.1 Biopolymer transport protein ExbD/TolR [Lacunisphaera sp.]
MITRPLELESRLSPPPRDLDAVAWVNVGLIALFFTLLGSRFVLAPGLLIGTGGQDFLLPTAKGLHPVPTASVVVNYRQDDVIIFEGAIIKLPELRERLGTYARQHPGEVLLLVADRRVSAQAVSDLAATAQSVGFAALLVAGGEVPAAENRLK